jgi:subtilisin family serine protease
MLHRLRHAAAVAVAAAALCAPADGAGLPGARSVADRSRLQVEWNGRTPVRAPRAAGAVTVAVVDSGADLSHPDLACHLWSNPGEIAGNGIDDDHDGIVDDVHGANLLDGTGDPVDDSGHGTHVAGIIAAGCAKGVGVAGVAPDARVMVVKALDDRADGTLDTVAAGIRYAVAHRARIINLSLSGPLPDAAVASAIDEAGAAGVLVVAAAGNTGTDDDISPVYPAALAAPNLVTATGTDWRGALAADANYGRATVDLSAPGVGILSTGRGGRYEVRSGSSMAAAYVSGALAVLAGARPDLGWKALRDALLSSARPTRLPVAAGRLDIRRALAAVRPDGQDRRAARARHPRTQR